MDLASSVRLELQKPSSPCAHVKCYSIAQQKRIVCTLCTHNNVMYCVNSHLSPEHGRKDKLLLKLLIGPLNLCAGMYLKKKKIIQIT